MSLKTKATYVDNEKVKKLFKKYDLNKNGVIDPDEFMTIMMDILKELGEDLPEKKHREVAEEGLMRFDLDKNGKIWTGCNIENATYGATNCAERTAIFKAVSEGVRDFEAIAIVGGPEDADGSPVLEEFCPPCGICRQVLSEFCSKDFKIILANKKGEQKLFTLAELLPESFGLK